MSLSTSRLSKIICQNLLHIDATSSNNAYQAQGCNLRSFDSRF